MQFSNAGANRRLSRRTLLAAVLASSAAASPALAEPSAFRSVKDVRPRIPDELDRPVRRETSSHRGWEIREDQFTIAANTSQADAEWAAAAVTKVRGQMAGLADRFTSVHRAADFGLNSLQVVIDGEPPRDRDAPLTTINAVGIQTQVLLNVSPGQPPLAQQLLRLREAAGFSLLHTAELDGVLPPWVVTGMASHVALMGQPDDAPPPNDFAPRGVPLGGEPWRFNRADQDRLKSQPQNLTDAAERVGFLLTGNDAQLAPQFLSSIKTSIEGGRMHAITAGAITFRRGEQALAKANPVLDSLVADHRATYDAWRKDPEMGQPVFEPATGISERLLAQEREMLVVLKLLRRVMAAQQTPPSVKIATFDREQGKTIVGNSHGAELPSMAELRSRLRDPALPAIATLDTDGSLLLSTDRRRIDRLLGWDGQRYRVARDGDRWVLVRQLADGRTLQGGLADNPEQPSRPKAEFTIRDPRAKQAQPAVAAR
jgi:hypothetical protein